MNEHDAIEAFKERNGGHWGEHHMYPVADWQFEVANGDTRLGYWEWAYAQWNS